ncbi:hypothetical protein [Streptomyces erythrochromogenes]
MPADISEFAATGKSRQKAKGRRLRELPATWAIDLNAGGTL